MNYILDSQYFGFVLTIVVFYIGIVLKNKYQLEIFNPLVVSIFIISIILIVFDIEYDTYYSSAKYITYLLTPTTICLAIPLYKQIDLLKGHFKAIIIGIFFGVIINISFIYIIYIIFKLNYIQLYTLLPKSITTAVGLPLSLQLNAIGEVTVLCIVLSAIFGSLFCNIILRLFKITNKVSIGLAIGTSCHALGTSKAFELGEIQGAMSSLSIVICAIFTVIIIQFCILFIF